MNRFLPITKKTRQILMQTIFYECQEIMRSGHPRVTGEKLDNMGFLERAFEIFEDLRSSPKFNARDLKLSSIATECFLQMARDFKRNPDTFYKPKLYQVKTRETHPERFIDERLARKIFGSRYDFYEEKD